MHSRDIGHGCYASVMIAAGVNVKALSTFMGHRAPRPGERSAVPVRIGP
jgi:hypothetical protein